MRLFRVVVVLPFIFVGLPALAAVSECDSALIVSTYNSLEASKSDWRMARHVDENTYNQIKHDAGASAVIYGFPVSASYSDFQENIRNFASNESESFTKEQFRNVAWTGLGSSAADAYKTCIKAQSRGLVLVPDGATDSDVTFRVSYSPIGGSANPLPVSWFGADAGGNQLPSNISAGETIIILKRPEKTSTLAVNSSDTSGFTDSVVLTPLAVPDPSEQFASRCVITRTPTPGNVTRGHAFFWHCPRLRAGTYQANLSVVPSASRAVRVSWSAVLTLKTEGGEQKFPLNTTSGAVIDVGVNAGIGTTFLSQGNVFDVGQDGALPIIAVNVDSTAWHGDFSQPSDDPISFPADASISLERM
jgi:hypothetical protein